MLPTLTEALGTNEFVEKVRKSKKDFDAKQKIRFDNNAKDLNDLPLGTLVWVQHNDTKRWDEKGVVFAEIRIRTYKIQMESGKLVYRNRKKIRKRKNTQIPTTTDVKKKMVDIEDRKNEAGKVRRSKRIRKISKIKLLNIKNFPKKGM